MCTCRVRCRWHSIGDCSSLSLGTTFKNCLDCQTAPSCHQVDCMVAPGRELKFSGHEIRWVCFSCGRNNVCCGFVDPRKCQCVYCFWYAGALISVLFLCMLIGYSLTERRWRHPTCYEAILGEMGEVRVGISTMSLMKTRGHNVTGFAVIPKSHFNTHSLRRVQCLLVF